LPKLMSKRRDVLLCGFGGDRTGAMPGPESRMLVLWVQVRLIGVLEALSGAFMAGQVIFFSVLPGAATMGVNGKVTVFSRYLL